MPEPNFDKAKLAWNLTWDPDWVTSVRFLGNTRKLAAGNNLGQIMLWELPEKPDAPVPDPVRRLDGHTNVISRLVSTGDGRWLISASYDHTIRYWDMQSEAKETEEIVLNARTIQYARDHKTSGIKEPPPLKATVARQASSKTLDVHKEWVGVLALSHDEKLLISGDDASQIVVSDRETGQESRRWKIKSWAIALALSPDDKQALIAERIPLVFDSGRRTAARLWNVSTGEEERDLSKEFKDAYIVAAAYSIDGKLLALGQGGETEMGKTWLFDPATGKKIRELTPGHQSGVTDLAFHPDGKHLASAGRDTTIRIWNIEDGKLVKEFGKGRGGQFKDWIHALSFSADGYWLAAADMAGAVQIWSLAD
jgi:WD40 repeat protein